MARDLATTGEHTHPVLDTSGWWRGDGRLLHSQPSLPPSLTNRAPVRPLLIAGAGGTLGRAFARICAERQLPYRIALRHELDISDADSVARFLDSVQPWAVANASGYVRVDDAELDSAACERDNLLGPTVLADACARRGIALLTFSTDLVFDGACRSPYLESARPRPLGVYGRSKAEAERRVLERMPDALIVRTSAFFGPWDAYNFVTCALRALRDGIPVEAAEDQVVSPTYVPDLVDAVLDLLIDAERGVWHLANAGAVTWAELAREAAGRAGLDASLVIAQSGGALERMAPRPAYSVLGSERGALLPTLDDALGRYFTQYDESRVVSANSHILL
jgi:dTDP-4-dehydrorhamnose reductase